MTGSTAALVSFEESSALLHELAGVEVSAKQVERAAEALGAEIAADEQHCVEKMGEVAPTMYLGMDGTGVPMRASEVAGRPGKQPDGSAKTREAKLVSMWTAESRDEEGKPVRKRTWVMRPAGDNHFTGFLSDATGPVDVTTQTFNNCALVGTGRYMIHIYTDGAIDTTNFYTLSVTYG